MEYLRSRWRRHDVGSIGGLVVERDVAPRVQLLPLLAAFRSAQPDAGMTLRVGNRTEVWGSLRDLEADLVVAGRPPSSIAAEVLGRARNTLVVIGRPDQPSSRTRREQLTRLRAATWLLREPGSGTRDATDELLAELGIDPPRMILGSNGAVAEAVAAGFGVALISIDAIRVRLDAGDVVLVDCPHTPIDRPWHLVAPLGAPISPTAALAARSLLDVAGGFAPTSAGRRLLRSA